MTDSQILANKANIHTLMTAVEQLQEKYREDRDRLDRMEKANAQLRKEITQLRQQAAVLSVHQQRG